MRLLVAAIALSFILNQPSPALGDAPSLFPCKVGNWWTYSTIGKGKGAQFRDTVVETKTAPNGTLLVRIDGKGAADYDRTCLLMRKGDATSLQSVKYTSRPALNNSFDPPKLIIMDKLIRGCIWIWNGKCTIPGNQSERWQVFPVENITVPAGKFDCVRVGGLYSRGNGKVMMYQMRWFAPNVGLVKSVDTIGKEKIGFELKAFHVVK